ncbi:metallophosphoesterase family protein [Tissierella carlieri]|uniref:metallophosphoesterase family protein n=1 Tax=Tissierella carlieri TaxID=689904 RepID=UPI0038701E9C
MDSQYYEVKGFIDFLDTYFKEVDIIVHSGDYISIEVIEALQKYKNFIGVWGNVDEPEVKNLIKEKEVVTIEGYRIGIFHGHGTISNTLDRAYEKFREDDVDIIIFGHSHQPLVKTKKGILMLNPGSLTNKRQERWYSYIILELNTESIDLQFKFFS